MLHARHFFEAEVSAQAGKPGLRAAQLVERRQLAIEIGQCAVQQFLVERIAAVLQLVDHTPPRKQQVLLLAMVLHLFRSDALWIRVAFFRGRFDLQFD